MKPYGYVQLLELLDSFFISSKHQEGSKMLSLITLLLRMRNLRSEKEAQYGERASMHTWVTVLLFNSSEPRLFMYQLALLCNKPFKIY